jgi:hypothetical protein
VFGWAERQARSGQRNGSKVRAVGVGTAFHPAAQRLRRASGRTYPTVQGATPHIAVSARARFGGGGGGEHTATSPRAVRAGAGSAREVVELENCREIEWSTSFYWRAS